MSLLKPAEILARRREAPCQGRRRQAIDSPRVTCHQCRGPIGPGRAGRRCPECLAKESRRAAQEAAAADCRA